MFLWTFENIWANEWYEILLRSIAEHLFIPTTMVSISNISQNNIEKRRSIFNPDSYCLIRNWYMRRVFMWPIIQKYFFLKESWNMGLIDYCMICFYVAYFNVIVINAVYRSKIRKRECINTILKEASVNKKGLHNKLSNWSVR